MEIENTEDNYIELNNEEFNKSNEAVIIKINQGTKNQTEDKKEEEKIFEKYQTEIININMKLFDKVLNKLSLYRNLNDVKKIKNRGPMAIYVLGNKNYELAYSTIK